MVQYQGCGKSASLKMEKKKMNNEVLSITQKNTIKTQMSSLLEQFVLNEENEFLIWKDHFDCCRKEGDPTFTTKLEYTLALVQMYREGLIQVFYDHENHCSVYQTFQEPQ